MRLILAIDAIFPPLTGIGRYAYELATRLPMQGDFEELRYLGMWSWADISSAGASSSGGGGASAMSQWLGHLRRAMATKMWAVEVYDAISEVWRKRLLQQGRGAVLHSPNYFLPAYDGPSVATVHDLSIHRFPETHPAARRRYFDLAFERSLCRADALITDSEAVRQELIADYAVPPERVRAIHLGVDSAFRPQAADALIPVLSRHGLAPSRYLLSVGTLEPRKRLDQLITAYADLPAPLRERYPLVLAGSSGWLNDRVQPLIERGRSQGWLRYLGYVPQADLPALYAGAHAFAMMSAYEGFGLPLVEAMACGVPVLTSDCSCMPEVVDGAALLAESGDVAAIRMQLMRLLEDESWRTQAVPSGLRRAGEMTWEHCVRQTLEVYKMVA
ncbi:MAG: glycosyltransferase family 4 protein [Comamonadaceae bacterium]|nr:glycosyltransferase family 4 protein [Comamonadaceae bacterium]